MTLSFNQIPNGARVPYFFVEFDTSKAQQGPAIQEYSGLLIGQRLSTGTKPAGQVDRVTSESQAKQFYGNGSMLAKMAEAWLKDNKVTSLSCIALDDAGAGVAATGSIDIGDGGSVKAGTLNVMIGGKNYQVAVAEGDTATEIAAALQAEIAADTDRQIDAAVNGVDDTIVDFTARHKGEAGNQIDIRVNYYDGEELPEDVTVSITAMASGATNPDIATAITAMGDVQYHVIGHAYYDDANLTALETELADRWGPIRQIEGAAITAKVDTFANMTTLGDSRNSPHNSILGAKGPTTPWEQAANIAGVVAFYGQIDPARPFQTLTLSSVLAPTDAEQFTFNERDLLLKDGIATAYVAAGGVVRIERVITTYQENAFGAPDTSLLDVNTLLTLSYLRYSFRTTFQLKYPRHKLANDGTNFAPGQAVITPKIAKAEAIAIFRQWESLALVEGIEQFKRDMIVERNASDPNRLDFLLPPDLVNQFRIGAAQIAFLL